MDQFISITFFNQWKAYFYYKKEKILFDEIKQEIEEEKEYAMNNTDIDSIHWCWNCKYSECEIH